MSVLTLPLILRKKRGNTGILRSPAAKNHFPNLRAEAEKAGADAFLTLDAQGFLSQ